MAGEAEITFVGNLGADPELRFTPSGDAVVALNVAVTPRKKQGDEWVEQDTTWYRVSAWRYDAEACAEHLHKGDKVRVTGRLLPSIFHADSGPRLSMDVTASMNGVTLVPRAAKRMEARSSAPDAGSDPWGDTPGF